MRPDCLAKFIDITHWLNSCKSFVLLKSRNSTDHATRLTELEYVSEMLKSCYMYMTDWLKPCCMADGNQIVLHLFISSSELMADGELIRWDSNRRLSVLVFTLSNINIAD